MGLERLQQTEFSPAPFLVYKPSKSGSGQALKLHLRLSPEWVDGDAGSGYFVRPKNQGLFLEIAPQEGKTDKGFPRFGWNSPGLVRCKLGLVDVSKLLLSIREVRHLGREVPFPYRPGPDREANPFAYTAFHKFGENSTAINYTFEQMRSIVRVSKSRDLARSIALDVHEELSFERYLELAHDAFLRVGIR
jgi:hypothetical protein